MNPIERFAQYAVAFEEVFVTDAWSRLDPFFAEDAVRAVTGGGPLALRSNGRAALIADLKHGVDIVDRRFDRRIPEIVKGPEERDGGVWMEWRLTLQRDGLPDLTLDGAHGTFFRGDAICRIEEEVSLAHSDALDRYLIMHGPRLLPVGGASASRRTRQRALVEGYARAKSNAAVERALAFCHDEFTLATVSFGVTSGDKQETEQHLRLFFHTFPDYAVTIEDMAFSDDAVACWGAARMSMRGAILTVPPTGRRAELPVYCVFTFKDNLLASEQFFFDLATLCDGIGVPIDTIRSALHGIAGASPRAAA